MKKSIGQMIRSAREAKEMKVEKLAKALVISPAYLSHLERDSHVRLSERVTGLLREVLGVRLPAKMVELHNKRSARWYKAYRAEAANPKATRRGAANRKAKAA